MRDPIFKGATRPVMWLGVPQMAFLGLVLCGALLAMWSFILVGGFLGFVVLLAAVFIYFVLRFVSADDPHRLLQRGKQLQSWFRGRLSHTQWSAHCATPYAVKRRHVIEEKGMRGLEYLFRSLDRLGRDDQLSRYVPFSNALTGSIVSTRHGDYLSTWRVKGLPFEGMGAEDIDARMDALNVFIRSLSSGKFAFWIHRVRRRITDSLASAPAGFAKELLDKYYGTLGDNGMMVTEIYCTVLYRPFPTTAARAIRKAGTLLISTYS